LRQHDESNEAVLSREQKYVVGSYARAPFHPRTADGAKLVDADGKVYWDLLGGIAVHALGYQHPRIVDALRENAETPLHFSNLFFHPTQGILAELLVQHSKLDRVFFCNSGTEANEAALKFSRLAKPGKSKIVALEESFHGRTFGSLAITGHEAYRAPFAPMIGESLFIAPNDIAALEAAVDAETSAIVLEPIMGEGGIIPLTPEFLLRARALADTFNATLIFDEVQCGLGRTGTMFAFQQSGVEPDIITLAKPLGGGLPLGAVIVNSRIASNVKPGHHGTTFGGNPLACRLGIAVVEAIVEERLLNRVNEVGTKFEAMLNTLAQEQPIIVDVRGQGMMWGIELDRPAAPIVGELRDKGFIVGSARERVLRLLPPYVVPEEALQQFVKTLGAILAAQPQQDAAFALSA